MTAHDTLITTANAAKGEYVAELAEIARLQAIIDGTPPPPPPPVDYRNGKKFLKIDNVLNKASDSAWNASLAMSTVPAAAYRFTGPVTVYTQALKTAVAKFQLDVLKFTVTGSDGFFGPKTSAALGLVWVP